MTTKRDDRRRAAAGAALAVALSFRGGAARAEPPGMKEPSARPKIEVLSADGRYSVSLGGFLQARYAAAVTPGEPTVSQFGAPRTRLYVFGHAYSRALRYRLMVGTPPHSHQVQLFDAYVEGQVDPALRLRAGRFKLPVFREWVESARLLASVDRSPLTQALLPGRDYGVMVSGGLASGAFEYAAGAFNGAGDVATKDSNAAPAAAARLVWNATGRPIDGEVDFANAPAALAVGASAYGTTMPEAPNTSPERGQAEGRVRMGGVEVAFRRRGLDLRAEAMGRSREPEGRGAELLGGGYLRVDQYLPPLQSAFGGRLTRLAGFGAPGLTRNEAELHAARYFDGHDLKIVASLGIARLDRPATWEHFVALQAQATF